MAPRALPAVADGAEHAIHDPFGKEGGLDDLDNRLGSVAPSDAAKSRVSSLGARVEWNQYGTQPR